MNVDHILDTLNRKRVVYMLAGGMNFLMRHAPVLTFDIDIWIEDTGANLERCESAMSELNAAWGNTETDWGPVAQRASGWLTSQSVYCLTSPHGAIDIFRQLRGLDSWKDCWARAVPSATSAGIGFRGLSDEDMLLSQLALDVAEQKPDRIRALQTALQGKSRP